ncbi:MAG TPA: flagellar assembly protein FliW [Acidimicrobiales bacterium]
MTTAVLEEIDALVTLEVPNGLVGVPEAQRFSLSRWGGDDSPYATLKALDADGLEFVVVPPSVFFPDYAPVVDDDLVQRLDLHEADDAVVLVIVTIGDPVTTSTANLLGPIVVNRHTNQAAQAVLSPDEHDPRRPLVG